MMENKVADASTNMTELWIANAVKLNPCVLLDSGNIRTCPVRLSFPNIFARSRPIPPNTEGKYGANLVFPIGADITLLQKAASEMAASKWPNAGKPSGPKIKTPFKSQEDMVGRYDGYEAGGVYISATGDRQPQVYDARQQPVTDPERVYPGVWVVATIRPFAYDKGVNKGVSFGLQAIMLVADDKRLGGGGSSPADFGGIQLDAAVSADGVFGDDEDAAAAKLFG
jgi:hypothetical protein